MNLGDHLKAYRKSRQLTQKELASTLGVSREYYARLEGGSGTPSTELLEQICSLPNLPLDRLFKRNDGSLGTKEMAETCQLCSTLRREDRKEIGRLIRRMLKR
ncbi:MAG TPA: XRE family transcriptional regulator [Bacteroidetes bacterium]|nr:XRE family transcriptional regulator [Bacteroidota bacterium]